MNTIHIDPIERFFFLPIFIGVISRLVGMLIWEFTGWAWAEKTGEIILYFSLPLGIIAGLIYRWIHRFRILPPGR